MKAVPRRRLACRTRLLTGAGIAAILAMPKLAQASCFDPADFATSCACTGPDADCDADGLADDVDPCPGIAQGQLGADAPVSGGFETLACWRALETRMADVAGFFGHGYKPGELQPVAVRRIRAEVPLDPIAPGPKPWPVRTGIVVVGVAVSSAVPQFPAGAATAKEVEAGFRTGAVLPNAALVGLQSFEYGDKGKGGLGWTASVEVRGYGLATAYVRSIHDAAKVSSAPVFLDALGFLTGRSVLDTGKDIVVVGSHGSVRVPFGWAPLKTEFGQPVPDLAAATPLVPVTRVRDTVCEAKALVAGLKLEAQTTPIPDYSRLGVFPPEDPRWNQSTELSSRPEIVSYSAAKVSVTSPDAVIRATAFGYRPVSNALRGPLVNAYTSKPLPPNATITHGAPTQYAAHGKIWEYEPPSDGVLAVIDPAKLCEPEGEKSCSCVPKRAYFALGSATVSGATADPYAWTVDSYLHAAAPEALFAALHKYAVPGTVAYRKVTDVLVRQPNASKRPYIALNVPVPAGASFRYPARQGFLPKALFASGVESAAGVFFQTPVGQADAWTLLTGSHSEAVRRVVGYTADGVAQLSDIQWIDETWLTPGLAGRTVIAVKLAGTGSVVSGWDKQTASWLSAPLSLMPGALDYVEYDLPADQVGPGVSWSGESWPVAVIAAEHLTASQWYPGATEWRTNYGNATQFTSQKYQVPKTPRGNVPPLFSNDALTHWEPNLAPNVAQSADQRLAACGVDAYKPNVASSHWPVVQNKASVAVLWGQPENKLSAPKSPYPNAWFADDYNGGLLLEAIGAGISPTSLHLHEQLDINWTFREPYIEPPYRAFLAGTPTEYCKGDASVIPGLSVSLACTEGILGDCTAAQLASEGGCTAANRLGHRTSVACNYEESKACGGSWYCAAAAAVYDSLACAGGTAAAAARYAASLFPLNILRISGGFGFANLDELNLFKRSVDPDRHRALEVEIEHRIATAGKRDGGDPCDGFQCTADKFQGANALFEELDPALAVNVLGDVPPGVFGVHSPSGDHDGLLPVSGAPPRVFPFSRFPGFASQRGAIYGATAKTFGRVGGGLAAGVAADAVTLLPAGVRERTIDASAFQNLGTRETSFRAQLVGDMILDCGHPPVHAEIHPYRAGLLHATPPPADFVGFERVARYSMFSWIRQIDGGETLAFDLWPPPRPRGRSKIAHRFLFPDTSPGSGFVCEPWPAASPNRLRCDLAKSDVSYTPGNADLCKDNARMLPSCATSLAGGLVEVYWQ